MSIFAVDEAGFTSGWVRTARRKTFLVGAQVDEAVRIRRFMLRRVTVDGLDATSTIGGMVQRLQEACKLILLPSACLAGFNVVDITQLHEETGSPIAVVNTRKPRAQAVRAALKKHFNDWDARWGILNKMGEAQELRLRRGKKLYCNVQGMRFEEFDRLVRGLIYFGDLPEPLRIARLVADAFASKPLVRS